MGLIECVPNICEGRDRRVLDAIADAVTAVPGARLLDRDESAAVHRSVYTIAGEAGAVADAALALARAAVERIDLSRYESVHPHIGALDVCPFVPLGDSPAKLAEETARQVAAQMAEELALPVFLFGDAAARPERRLLGNIRRCCAGGLAEAMAGEAGQPDLGPSRPHPSAGAAAVGARPLLIAFNINLDTDDAALARRVAARLRESGRAIRDTSGRTARISGRFAGLRAIGWSAPAMRRAQVSCNITDPVAAPLHEVYRACVEEAERLGCRVTGSEIVGLVPLESMLAAGHAASRLRRITGVAGDAALIRLAAASLNLGDLRPFVLEEKVLDFDRGSLWQLPG